MAQGEESGAAATTRSAEAAAREAAIRLTKRAGYASVAVALLLIAVKTAAWLATGSVAMLSTLVDSMLDSLASVMTLLAVHHAARPPDREHRFGHGKVEGVAGLVQAAIIAGSAVFLLFEAVSRLIRPQPVENSVEGIVVIVFSIVVTGLLVSYQRSVARRTGSIAITADSMHYATDLMVNAGVILALVLAGHFGLSLADPIIGLVIVALILRGAYGIFQESFNHLMDHEMPDEKRAEILEVVRAHPLAEAVHDLRTRYSGTVPVIQMHLELDPNMTLSAAHAIADEIEDRIRARFPGAEIIIHQDPAGLEGPHSPVARRPLTGRRAG